MEQNTTPTKSYGAVVASIIIILLLIVGALYFWGQALEKKSVVNEDLTPIKETVVEENQVPANDSIESIEQDLKDTQDLKDIDADLKQI